MPKQDTSRRIVVTGVSRGLGRALVDQFIAQDQTVLGCARSGQAIEELVARHGSPHSFHVVDVAREDQVASWAQSVLADGPVDLLVNNAALINRNAPLWEVPHDEFSQLIDANIKGVAAVIRHFLPAMLQRQSGVIANFSSYWGRSTAPQVAPYCASKWAVEGLTGALAKELPPGMAAVSLNPGIIDTDMLRSCFGDAASGYPGAADWAERAAPFILQLGSKDNGQPLTVPD